MFYFFVGLALGFSLSSIQIFFFLKREKKIEDTIHFGPGPDSFESPLWDPTEKIKIEISSEELNELICILMEHMAKGYLIPHQPGYDLYYKLIDIKASISCGYCLKEKIACSCKDKKT